MTRISAGAPLMVWHRRYGHIAPSTIIEIANKNLVEGLNLTDRKIEDCEACLITKSRRSPFLATSSPAPHLLYRIFIDLAFVDEPDHEGRTIFLSIVDQHSTAKWAIPLRSKRAEEITETFQDWRSSVEVVTGTKVRRVRSDNGSEFVNSTFGAELRRAGIVYEKTAPYTPEQNGQVERLNESLITLVKAMLNSANLPKTFWSLALANAAYVSNRTVHARIDGKTAYEIIMHKKPVVSHLQSFGTTAYAHIDKTQSALQAR